MHRFRKILFSPLAKRGNPAAARRVAELAARTQASLTLFSSAPEPSRLQRLLHRSDYLEEVQEAEIKATAANLARCARDLTSVDVEVEMKTTTGNPSLRIIQEVVAAGNDLVVVTTDDDDEDQATINRLLRKCPCPVWVIRPTRARVQRVLASINPDPLEAELNHTILQVALSMVELNGGELHLVHAWELYGEATMRHSAFLHTPAEKIDALLEHEESSHRAALDRLLGDAGVDGEPWQIHFEKGRATSVVPEVVRRHRINLLVMGTVARTGVSGLLIGNTAESVLDHVRCSVVAIKPPDFVSPIEPPGDDG